MDSEKGCKSRLSAAHALSPCCPVLLQTAESSLNGVKLLVKAFDIRETATTPVAIVLRSSADDLIQILNRSCRHDFTTRREKPGGDPQSDNSI